MRDVNLSAVDKNKRRQIDRVGKSMLAEVAIRPVINVDGASMRFASSTTYLADPGVKKVTVRRNRLCAVTAKA